MKFFKIIFLFFCSFLLSQEKKDFKIGEILELDSKILNEKRILNINLPQEFNPEERYDVIYLLDGSASEDFLHVSGLVQFFNLQFKMPKTIIVGIANIDRKRDFTFPTTIENDKKAYPTTGGSEKFIEFLEKELLPFINQKYKTTDKKYVIGQSLGGLLASEILIKKPLLFNQYIITSPSFWWDDESLLKLAEEKIDKKDFNNTFVYISVGKEHPTMIKEAKKFAEILNKKNIKNEFRYFEKENHATILHNSLYEAFKILFPYKD